MDKIKQFFGYIWSRKTTAFGYVQVWLGVLATAAGVFTDRVLRYVVLVNGVLTASIGHYNNSQLKKANDAKPDNQPRP